MTKIQIKRKIEKETFYFPWNREEDAIFGTRNKNWRYMQSTGKDKRRITKQRFSFAKSWKMEKQRERVSDTRMTERRKSRWRKILKLPIV
jgi:hypothetical protein